jgi:alkyldihydroxyacetonephosphate synthase
MMDLLRERLAFAVGEQHVSAAPADLAEYGRGPDLPAEIVVWPAAGNEVAQIVGLVREHGGALFPVRQGTRLPATDRRPRVLCDLRRMASVLHLDETSLTVHAQAGIPVRVLEEALARRGLTLGYFPVEALGYPLGALLARRHPELAAAHAGPLLGSCIALSAVLANGGLAHTRVAPRHAAGPDLMHLLLGGEGLLGIITAAVLRVQRAPEERRFVAFRYHTVEDAFAAAIEALRHGTRLAALRLYDAEDARRCFGPDAPAAGPHDPRGALLVACAAGPAELCEAEALVLAEECAARGGVDAGTGPAEHWWRRRSIAPEDPGRLAVDPHALVLHAALMNLLPLYQAVSAAARAASARCAASFARLHLGGGCLIVSLQTETHARARVVARVREAAAPFVLPDALAHLGLLAALKARLDPDDVLNPGHLTPATAS